MEYRVMIACRSQERRIKVGVKYGVFPMSIKVYQIRVKGLKWQDVAGYDVVWRN